MKTRFKRNRRRKIGEWPEGVEAPEAVAEKVRYLGSSEHKDHPSLVGEPALRSDATPCEQHLTTDPAGNTAALRKGITRLCTSQVFEGGFPKYVWTWLGRDLYEARHINGPRGTYKGYKLEPTEYPDDRNGRLNWEDP